MAWAKFDDQFTEHPKVVAAGPWAELLAMRAVIYCARYETDGHVRATQLARLAVGVPSVKRRVASLVEQGLWTEDSEGDGWWVHDFLEYHPSREERETEREQARKRMRRVRTNKTGTESEVRETFALPRPVPSRRDISSTDGLRAFNDQRARDEAKSERDAGGSIRSVHAVASWKAAQTDFIAESARLWAHRDCPTCGGKGHTEAYAPGAGNVKTPCTEVVE